MTKRITLSGPQLDELEALGKSIRLARLRRNLTQQAVAERAGLSIPTVVNLEAGAGGVSLAALVKVLDALGLSGRLKNMIGRDEIGEELDLINGRKLFWFLIQRFGWC